MKKITMMTMMALLACMMTLFVVQQSMAANTTKNVTDHILNTAHATYTDVTTAAMTPVDSNTVDVTVNRVYKVDVTITTPATCSPTSDSAIYEVTVSNLGNMDDTFSLSSAHTGGTGAWTPTVKFYDTNANAVANDGVTGLVASTGVLTNTTGTIKVYANVAVPGGAALGTTSIEDFTATSQAAKGGEAASDTATTTVCEADLNASTKTSSPTHDKAGATITYTIHLDNPSAFDATDVTVSDDLTGLGVTYVAASVTGGNYNAGTNTIEYGGVGTALLAGATFDITFQATVNAGQADATDIDNVANISWKSGTNSHGPIPKHGHTTVDAPLLAVDKYQSLTGNGSDWVKTGLTAAPGAAVYYRVVVTNSGHDDALSVIITDTPDASNVTSVTIGALTNCTLTNIAGTLTTGTATLAKTGGSLSFEYSVTVNQ